MAVKALEQQAHAAVQHCRNVNAYVASALADWAKTGSGPSAAIPRQMAPAAGARAGSAAGTSSFGMSGTNAHLLASLPFTPADPATLPGLWQRDRWKLTACQCCSTVSYTTLSCRLPEDVRIDGTDTPRP